MDDAAAREAADTIAAARLARRPLEALPARLAPSGEDEAYRVQALLHERLPGVLAGHKIGCTTRVMQEYVGIANPCAGGVFAATVQHGAGSFATAEHLRLGVECELAVVLGPEAAVASVHAAIEVVEDRYADWRSLDAPTLIADDFFGAGCVLGPPHDPAGLDLRAVTAGMTVNGVEVGRGAGRDILGDPLEALRWLAARRERDGAPLRAGELVLLGSVVQTHWVEAGDAVVVENDPLGRVEARFS